MTPTLLILEADGLCVLQLSQKFGESQLRELEERLRSLFLSIDLSRCKAVDAASLERLIRFGKRLERKQGAFAFNGLPKDFERVLHQNRQDDFPSFETQREALHWLSQQRKALRTAAAVEKLLSDDKTPRAVAILNASETRRLELAFRLLDTTKIPGG